MCVPVCSVGRARAARRDALLRGRLLQLLSSLKSGPLVALAVSIHSMLLVQFISSAFLHVLYALACR